MINIKEIIRIIKEKQSISHQRGIVQQAHNCICLDDFDNKVYIAYNGTPLIPIEESWTPKQILSKLEETRKGYVNFKMKQSSQPVAAFW